MRPLRHGANVFGIEPSATNCASMRSRGIDCFAGTIEEWAARDERQTFDVVAILWTLENCQDCRAMLRAASELAGPDGSVVVATGSRILVPFKKPLGMYLSDKPADAHAFRFSANTLEGALAVSGLEAAYLNRYLDHDVLLAIGRATGGEAPSWHGDDYLAVWSFFERWYAETALYWPEASAAW